MKNNPVHLITEEDLKQASVLENSNANKKDKKDDRRRKATGKSMFCLCKKKKCLALKIFNYEVILFCSPLVSFSPLLKIL